MVYYFYLLKNFPLFFFFFNFYLFIYFFVIHTVKDFIVVNEAEADFLKSSCFSYNPADFGNLISGFSAISKSGLYIWKFSVHIMLKTGKHHFEHFFAKV